MQEEAKPVRLLDRLREAVRVRHYSIRTEEAYVQWARRFILFHNKRHPSSMGSEEVNGFLTHLAVKVNVSASTQNQALSAILFLYKNVLDDPLPWMSDIVRARRPRRDPVVLTREEVGPCSLSCNRRLDWWPRCCMERGCACWNVFDFE